MTHISGHEPAEQMVSIMFQGIELSLRLGSEGIKTLAEMIYASTQKEANLNMRSGRVKQIAQLLKENKPLRTSKLDIKDIPAFKRQAKKYGILYTIVRDIKSIDNTCTVIMKEEEQHLFNELVNSLGLKGYAIENNNDIKKNENPSKRVSKGLEKNMTKGMNKESVLSNLEKHKDSLQKESAKAVKTIIRHKEK